MRNITLAALAVAVAMAWAILPVACASEDFKTSDYAGPCGEPIRASEVHDATRQREAILGCRGLRVQPSWKVRPTWRRTLERMKGGGPYHGPRCRSRDGRRIGLPSDVHAYDSVTGRPLTQRIADQRLVAPEARGDGHQIGFYGRGGGGRFAVGYDGVNDDWYVYEARRPVVVAIWCEEKGRPTWR